MEKKQVALLCFVSLLLNCSVWKLLILQSLVFVLSNRVLEMFVFDL